MTKFRSLCKWFYNNILIIQAVLILIALCISVFFGFASKTNEIIITLLILITIEFFLLSVGYLESMQKSILEVYNKVSNTSNDSIQLINRNEFDWKKEIIQAQNDVFVSGSGLVSLYDGIDIFISWPVGKDFRVLSLNLDNNLLMDEFCKMHGASLTTEKLKKQSGAFSVVMEHEKVKNNKSITFAKADRITPITYVAVDIIKLSKFSFIKAQHYLHEKNAGESSISILVRPGCQLFDMYKEQIEILWDKRQ